MSDLAFASSLLRAGALVSVVLWAVGVVGSVWFQWSQLEPVSEFANSRPQPPLLGALAVSLTQTWGYLLVAVVAFAAALLVAQSSAGPLTGTVAPPTDGDEA